MNIQNKKYIKLLLLLCILLLIIAIFNIINDLVANKFIIECFSTSHTVDLPLTTKYSCNNFCGPTARCAITGQQCFTDIDCPGCQPPINGIPNNKQINIPGNDDAGKLTFNMTPQYSTLTSGFGTKERVINNNAKPIQTNFGTNKWLSSYYYGEKLFNKRYKPNNLSYMPNYTKQSNLLGDTYNDGPYPSNYYFT